MFTRNILIAAILISIEASAQTSHHHTPGLIDGSKTPQLIPDEEIYPLLFLTATTPTNGALDVERRRATAFLASLALGADDQRAFALESQAYRKARELAAAGPRPKDAAEAQLQQIELARSAIRALSARVSGTGFAKLQAFAQSQKRAVKLIPLPAMPPLAAIKRGGWVARLMDMFSVRVVSAQDMTPYASLYTAVNGDADGNLYATGTTNANSGCGCHSTNAYTTLTLPSGHMAGDTRFGPGEVTQATASLTMSGTDFQVAGDLVAVTVHNAYCPINQTQFVNYEQTSQRNPLINIRAYYKCDQSGGSCITSLGHYVHRRCNSGNTCPTVLSRQNNWFFTLQTVSQISIGGGYLCVADRATAQQQSQCYSPDPVP